MKRILIPIIIAATFFFSCDLDNDTNDEDYLKAIAEQFTADSTLIEQYLSDSSLEASYIEPGLFYVVEEQGTGENPELTSLVTVD